MKAFFTASQRGKKQYNEFYEKIVEEIKKLDLQLLDDDVIKKDENEFEKELDEGGRDKQIEFYRSKIRTIQQADLCIFEGSTPSLSIGFVIQKALEFNKPTIVLFYKDLAPFFLAGNDDDKLIVKSYNEKTLKKVLKETVEIAKERRDKRFNFFISPKLLEYLEKESKQEGITKSKFIRNLIVNHMRKSQE